MDSSDPDNATNRHAPNPLLGDLFMLLAQVFRPAQYVLEESVLAGVDDVMLCVGWEGLWGLFLCILFAPIFYLIPAPGAEHLDSLYDSFVELKASTRLQLSASLFVANVALYNWLGMTITKKGNSTVRSVLNSLRTASIWVLSLALGWDRFQPLELVGFIAIATGSSIYNEIFWKAEEPPEIMNEHEIDPLVPTKCKSII